MSQEKTVLEIIAANVEEATAKGLRQLGLPAEAAVSYTHLTLPTIYSV